MKKRGFSFNFLVFLFALTTKRCASQGHELKVLDRLLTGYDRRAIPTGRAGKAIQVHCQLYIRSLGFLDPSSMDYQVDLYFRQTWTDSRLDHANLTRPLDLSDPVLVTFIWKPQVYFPNAKEASFVMVTVPNISMRINPGGKISYMLRLRLQFNCAMELSTFPLDSQICSMEIASFSKTTKELKLRWKRKNPVSIYKGLMMPQFEISRFNPTTCKEAFQIGNYSCLTVEFHMKRSLGFHLVQSYLPTGLFVVISWLSFWMDLDNLLARTSLGITTLLTVSSKSSGIQGGVPQVSYVKAIDIWMGTCTAFVFCSLLELTLINCIARVKETGGQTKTKQTVTTVTANSDHCPAVASISSALNDPIRPFVSCSSLKDEEGGATEPAPAPREKLPPKLEFCENKKLSSYIDAQCRLAFPIAFSGFVLVYWCYYLL